MLSSGSLHFLHGDSKLRIAIGGCHSHYQKLTLALILY
ncbi:hypothetical protein PPIS_a2734 [Pseudoalteromonas piscicida]|uniref:Uncharacterized protein n=1 Tax=Pseudoalteromonas piscicida TaxID=43662 RepID=A0ABN5CKV5_PSEO7|nr:hypothetical protein PPIS_a2734 [Pseudoalteromonas piscicida]